MKVVARGCFFSARQRRISLAGQATPHLEIDATEEIECIREAMSLTKTARAYMMWGIHDTRSRASRPLLVARMRIDHGALTGI